MSTTSRDELRRVVDQLPNERLAAAAELLEALTLHDQRVSAWRLALSAEDVSEIAASLRREYGSDEWITDKTIEEWLDSPVGGDQPPS